MKKDLKSVKNCKSVWKLYFWKAYEKTILVIYTFACLAFVVLLFFFFTTL